MGYYSFIAIAPHPVGVKDPLIMLDKGVNTFTAVTDDVDGLVAHLESEGINVTQINQLDGLEPVPPEASLLLPGESPAALPPVLRSSVEETDP